MSEPSETQKIAADRPQSKKYDVPPGWGHDELSKFWDAARHNQLGTFVQKNPAYARLAAIDNLFCVVGRDWLNPSDEIAALLLLRTHSAFRVAAGLACAGQVTEAYVLNRSVLENAAYALHLNRNKALRKVWLDRHVDLVSLEASSNALSYRKVQKTVAAVNRHAGERFKKFYQQTIDWRPPQRAVGDREHENAKAGWWPSNHACHHATRRRAAARCYPQGDRTVRTMLARDIAGGF